MMSCPDCETSGCAFCHGEVPALRAEVADLKARLKACHKAWYDPDGDAEDDERIPRATDLRVKDWRKHG